MDKRPGDLRLDNINRAHLGQILRIYIFLNLATTLEFGVVVGILRWY